MLVCICQATQELPYGRIPLVPVGSWAGQGPDLAAGAKKDVGPWGQAVPRSGIAAKVLCWPLCATAGPSPSVSLKQSRSNHSPPPPRLAVPPGPYLSAGTPPAMPSLPWGVPAGTLPAPALLGCCSCTRGWRLPSQISIYLSRNSPEL